MDIRILSLLACRYYQGPNKDRAKTDQETCFSGTVNFSFSANTKVNFEENETF